MKKLITALAFILPATGNAGVANSIECTMNGAPVAFTEIPRNGGFGIWAAEANLAPTTKLEYSYYIPYEIGGRLDLIIDNERMRMLAWDTRHETNILEQRVLKNGHEIHCKVTNHWP